MCDCSQFFLQHLTQDVSNQATTFVKGYCSYQVWRLNCFRLKPLSSIEVLSILAGTALTLTVQAEKRLNANPNRGGYKPKLDVQILRYPTVNVSKWFQSLNLCAATGTSQLRHVHTGRLDIATGIILSTSVYLRNSFG